MDSRAPLAAAAGGFAESELTRTTRVYLLGAWVRRLPKGYDAKLTPRLGYLVRRHFCLSGPPSPSFALC